MNKKQVSRLPHFTNEELENLITNSERTCVYVKRCKRLLQLHPFYIRDIRVGVKDALREDICKYDSESEGILLAYQKARVTTTDYFLTADQSSVNVQLEADFYLFKPEVGSKITGTVHEKSSDLIGCLTLGRFNIACPREDDEQNWPGDRIQCGQEITVKVTQVDLEPELPYIRGCIVELPEAGKLHKISVGEESDSGFGGRETNSDQEVLPTMKQPYIAGRDSILEGKKRKKRKEEEQQDVSISPPKKKTKVTQANESFDEPHTFSKRKSLSLSQFQNSLLSHSTPTDSSRKKPRKSLLCIDDGKVVQNDSDSELVKLERSVYESTVHQDSDNDSDDVQVSATVTTAQFKYCNKGGVLEIQQQQQSVAQTSDMSVKKKSKKSKKGAKKSSSESSSSDEDSAKATTTKLKSLKSPKVADTNSNAGNSKQELIECAMKLVPQSTQKSKSKHTSSNALSLSKNVPNPKSSSSDSDSSSDDEPAKSNVPHPVSAVISAPKTAQKLTVESKIAAKESSSEDEEPPKTVMKQTPIAPQKKPVITKIAAKESSSDSESSDDEKPSKTLPKQTLQSLQKKPVITKIAAKESSSDSDSSDEEPPKTATIGTPQSSHQRPVITKITTKESSSDSDSSDEEEAPKTQIKPTPTLPQKNPVTTKIAAKESSSDSESSGDEELSKIVTKPTLPYPAKQPVITKIATKESSSDSDSSDDETPSKTLPKQTLQPLQKKSVVTKITTKESSSDSDSSDEEPPKTATIGIPQSSQQRPVITKITTKESSSDSDSSDEEKASKTLIRETSLLPQKNPVIQVTAINQLPQSPQKQRFITSTVTKDSQCKTKSSNEEATIKSQNVLNLSKFVAGLSSSDSESSKKIHSKLQTPQKATSSKGTSEIDETRYSPSLGTPQRNKMLSVSNVSSPGTPKNTVLEFFNSIKNTTTPTKSDKLVSPSGVTQFKSPPPPPLHHESELSILRKSRSRSTSASSETKKKRTDDELKNMSALDFLKEVMSENTEGMSAYDLLQHIQIHTKKKKKKRKEKTHENKLKNKTKKKEDKKKSIDSKLNELLLKQLQSFNKSQNDEVLVPERLSDTAIDSSKHNKKEVSDTANQYKKIILGITPNLTLQKTDKTKKISKKSISEKLVSTSPTNTDDIIASLLAAKQSVNKKSKKKEPTTVPIEIVGSPATGEKERKKSKRKIEPTTVTPPPVEEEKQETKTDPVISALLAEKLHKKSKKKKEEARDDMETLAKPEKSSKKSKKKEKAVESTKTVSHSSDKVIAESTAMPEQSVKTKKKKDKVTNNGSPSFEELVKNMLNSVKLQTLETNKANQETDSPETPLKQKTSKKKKQHKDLETLSPKRKAEDIAADLLPQELSTKKLKKDKKKSKEKSNK